MGWNKPTLPEGLSAALGARGSLSRSSLHCGTSNLPPSPAWTLGSRWSLACSPLSVTSRIPFLYQVNSYLFLKLNLISVASTKFVAHLILWTDGSLYLIQSGGIIHYLQALLGASLVAQRLKHLPAKRETWVRSLGWEDPLEKEMATHSSILAWRIPWKEEPGGLQSKGSQRVGHNWTTSLSYLSKVFISEILVIIAFYYINAIS